MIASPGPDGDSNENEVLSRVEDPERHYIEAIMPDNKGPDQPGTHGEGHGPVRLQCNPLDAFPLNGTPVARILRKPRGGNARPIRQHVIMAGE